MVWLIKSRLTDIWILMVPRSEIVIMHNTKLKKNLPGSFFENYRGSKKFKSTETYSCILCLLWPLLLFLLIFIIITQLLLSIKQYVSFKLTVFFSFNLRNDENSSQIKISSGDFRFLEISEKKKEKSIPHVIFVIFRFTWLDLLRKILKSHIY